MKTQWRYSATLHRFGIVIILIAGLSCHTSLAAGAKVPALRELPKELADVHPQLTQKRARLQWERDVIRERAAEHNAKCRPIDEDSPHYLSCTQALAELQEITKVHVQASETYNATVHIIVSLYRYADRPQWDDKERKRIRKAMRTLTEEGDLNVRSKDVQATWQNILARKNSDELARLAASSVGPGLPGAGTQTQHQDCAVFALANAANLPYGVVAGRAAELIRDGEWRTAEERAQPQKTIERSGLNGGEVIILAEIFGEVQVVPSADFSKTLKEGRPVMANLVPSDGDFDYGHQVVLTRTFQRDGQTWYEMMDSNQGPMRRLYLSQAELNTVLKESGIVYRPDDKKTLKLMR